MVAYGGVARMWVIVGELDLIESRGKWQAIKTPSSHTVTERQRQTKRDRERERRRVSEQGKENECVCVCGGAWHMIV